MPGSPDPSTIPLSLTAQGPIPATSPAREPRRPPPARGTECHPYTRRAPRCFEFGSQRTRGCPRRGARPRSSPEPRARQYGRRFASPPGCPTDRTDIEIVRPGSKLEVSAAPACGARLATRGDFSRCRTRPTGVSGPSCAPLAICFTTWYGRPPQQASDRDPLSNTNRSPTSLRSATECDQPTGSRATTTLAKMPDARCPMPGASSVAGARPGCSARRDDPRAAGHRSHRRSVTREPASLTGPRWFARSRRCARSIVPAPAALRTAKTLNLDGPRRTRCGRYGRPGHPGVHEHKLSAPCIRRGAARHRPRCLPTAFQAAPRARGRENAP